MRLLHAALGLLAFAVAACGSNEDTPSGASGASGAQGGTGAGSAGAGASALGGAGAGGAGAGAGQGGTSAGESGAGGASGAAGSASGNGGSGGDRGGSGGAASGAAGDASGAGGGASGGGAGGGAGFGPEELTIANVWSGHPVRFALLTHEARQWAAFYDEERALTVAARELGSSDWELVRLPTSVGWDSHNDIVMAIDDDGYLHLSGNMHSSPLVYFRTSSPFDIRTFEKLPMTGMNEERCTYPQFFRSLQGELIYMYRDGESGNGNHVFNAYSTATKSWRRLLGTALTNGEGARNAYPVGPVQGPDGLFHLVWVWRETPDASTNHDLSYARTKNLVDWESAAGGAIALPITLGASDIVDPVPTGGGMINNNTKVGFDAEERPIVAYHKFDARGNTQLYNARFESGAWVPHVTSDWDYRWDFGGGGTLVFEIEVEPVVLQPDGTLTQNFFHAREGGFGAYRLDPETLRAEASIPQPVPYPPELAEVESTTPEMQVRWQSDAGAGPDASIVYLLRWETLPSNRDMPRNNVPPPTPLRLYGFRAQ